MIWLLWACSDYNIHKAEAPAPQAEPSVEETSMQASTRMLEI